MRSHTHTLLGKLPETRPNPSGRVVFRSDAADARFSFQLAGACERRHVPIKECLKRRGGYVEVFEIIWCSSEIKSFD